VRIDPKTGKATYTPPPLSPGWITPLVPRHASVSPWAPTSGSGLAPVLHAPVHAQVHHHAHGAPGLIGQIQVVVHSHLNVDGKQMAENTSEVVARHKALH
jgi:hypothetical protein